MKVLQNRFDVSITMTYFKDDYVKFVRYNPIESPDPLCCNTYDDSKYKEKFEEHLIERCVVESGFCMCEINAKAKELNIYGGFSIDLRSIILTIFIDPISLEWIDFYFEDIYHDNVGFDHLYDDSNYPNDF